MTNVPIVPIVPLLSFDEYEMLYGEGPIKHEFIEGYVRAMAGGRARTTSSLRPLSACCAAQVGRRGVSLSQNGGWTSSARSGGPIVPTTRT